MAVVNVLFAEDLVKIQDRIAVLLNGLEDIRRVCQRFTPEAVSDATGLDPQAIRQVARHERSLECCGVWTHRYHDNRIRDNRKLAR